MISFYQTRCGGDCTGPYDVSFTKGMTVKQFIDELLTTYKREWGEITIRIYGSPRNDVACISYSHGELKSKIPEKYINREIYDADGSGGWSRSDFILYV